MRRIKILLMFTLVFVTLSGMGNASFAANFEDVSGTSSYFSYIHQLKELGVADGIEEGLFGPGQPLTRAQFAKFVSVAFKLEENGSPVPFSDIQDHWAANYIRAANQAGITNGTSDSTFSPNQFLLRQEAAAMVWRYAKKVGLSPGTVLEFSAEPDPWAAEGTSSVIAHGWYGKEVKQDNAAWSYRPKDAMTREEMAALLALAMKDIPALSFQGSPGVSSSFPSGVVPYGSMVILSTPTSGAAIYYTTDGSDPKTSHTRKHYQAPIAMLKDVQLKTYAVYSSSDKVTASRVSTYRYAIDGPVQAQPAGLNDPLDNFDQVLSRTNMYIADDKPAYFGGDSGRMARTSEETGEVIYRTGYDISSFIVYSYFFTGVAIEKFRLFASEDGNDYTEVPAKVYPVGYPANNWQQYAYEASSLPPNTRFLKIELPGSAKNWTPQLSKVILNRSAASVDIKSTRSTESSQTELSSASAGARIYYRLNKGSAFQPYKEPLHLTGYNVLETYAVKDGMALSPIRKYTINASSDVKVDKFGQMVSANFSTKVKHDSELKTDAAADAAYYGSLNPPKERDRYGGLAGSAAKYGLRGTGFFKIRQLGSRKVMTTPEGNLFFSLGVNGITSDETYTMVKGREEEFEWIPPYEGAYQSAFIGPKHDSFSFYLANKYKKTGEFPTDSSMYSEAVGRLKNWGFNSAGGYSPEKYGSENNFPHTRTLPLGSMDWANPSGGIDIFDIFAPDAEAKIDLAFKKALTPYKNDPFLIGYFIGNEYDFHKFYSHVPKLKASSAAIKGRLVQRLKDKYVNIGAFNSSWGTSFTSFEDLKEAELPLETSQAWKDMDDFFYYYLDTFFGTVSRLYHKYDPNHLLLGDRWITTTFHNEKIRAILSKVEGKYVDVISINYYTYKLETDLLKDVYEKTGGKPILVSEFGYGTEEQGLDPLLPNAAFNQTERGLRYRNYVEGLASLDFVVGTHLFNYVDQAGSGRYWSGIGDWSERYNSGLVNVSDRPYKDYLKGIMATNYDIYKVMLRERTKFYHDFSKK
ncbi:S-layer homology domain-containing protein [Paenibacillus alkalitolerans]|uniref:S-layer homology domain-containing protein n=1 Tax=Paenibacillus alkalitolerans TaxID=2799335 RepID=UPI0018F5DC62|nr:S-layer homology domain-containing protein [Paenibacillus alkalitolerans]